MRAQTKSFYRGLAATMQADQVNARAELDRLRQEFAATRMVLASVVWSLPGHAYCLPPGQPPADAKLVTWTEDDGRLNLVVTGAHDIATPAEAPAAASPNGQEAA